MRRLVASATIDMARLAYAAGNGVMANRSSSLLVLPAVFLCLAALSPASAAAEALPLASASLQIEFLPMESQTLATFNVPWSGAGSAGVTGSSISSLSAGIFSATDLLVDVDPDLVPPILAVRLDATSGSGTFAFDGLGNGGGAMAINGSFEPCWLSTPCGFVLVTIPFTQAGAGFGLGGSAFMPPVFSGIHQSIQGALWSTGTLCLGSTCRSGVPFDGSTVTLVTSLVATSPSYGEVPAFATLQLTFPPACENGVDDDGDGLVDHLADPGCAAPDDLSERSPLLPCDDGADNDGDGRIDFVAAGGGDPACANPGSVREDPQCQDGLNNDSAPGIDFDGGASLDLDDDDHIDVEFNPATPPIGTPDPQCSTASGSREASSGRRCGLGFELVLLVPVFGRLARRRAGKSWMLLG